MRPDGAAKWPASAVKRDWSRATCIIRVRAFENLFIPCLSTFATRNSIQRADGHKNVAALHSSPILDVAITSACDTIGV